MSARHLEKHVEIIPASGTEVLIPLNKLKKSANNARKTPHSEAAIEAYAASIAAKGILQNLVVEPELDGEGTATGFYLVTIGEGRRLAQLLRVKRKEIRKTEPIRCIVDTANDPHEISLDENVTRENMHPADQFEAFRKLSDERGFGAEEIAARFGVRPHVVQQRLRLGTVSDAAAGVGSHGNPRQFAQACREAEHVVNGMTTRTGTICESAQKSSQVAPQGQCGGRDARGKLVPSSST
ncbi:ParB-like chromosome segregation protein Spo0J [Bradyrhizobium sp. USDA 3256]